MPAPSIVKYAGQVNSSGSGFFAGFDDIGAYQPAVGNLVILNTTLTVLPRLPGWDSFTDLYPFGYEIVYKIWEPGDSTTAIWPGVGERAWNAVEITGIDPLNPVQGFSACFGGSDDPDPTLPQNGFGTLTVTNAQNLVLIMVSTDNTNGQQLGPGDSVASNTVFNEIGFNSPAVCSVAGMTGSALSLACNPAALGPGVVSTQLFPSTIFDPNFQFKAVMFAINPVPAPPVIVARTLSNQRRSATFPLRAAVSRV
jgi:hypothetical protein